MLDSNKDILCVSNSAMRLLYLWFNSYGTWCGDRVPGEGDVKGWLVSQRGRIHPPADEEASPAAEQYPHHQQHPESKKRHISELWHHRTHTYLSNDSKKSLLLMLLTVDKSVNIDIAITRCDVEAKLCIAVQTGKAIN